MTVLDYDKLTSRLASDKFVFQSAQPFPYIIIDNFLEEDSAESLLKEFGQRPSDGGSWNQYTHFNERKSGLTRMKAMGNETRSVINELSSSEFVRWLSNLSGIEGLIADPDLDGGGLHEIRTGGFLNIHTDFLSHTERPHWRRQLNLLLYLNKGWRSEWNGDLELWDEGMGSQVASIEPLFNRCVIFHTTEKSFHGHPIPVACPKENSRKSLALYYFSDAGVPLKLKPTYYRAKPDEPLVKHALVAVDRWMVRAYSFLKRYTPINDGVISKLLRKK